jgi:hypothetical protein
MKGDVFRLFRSHRMEQFYTSTSQANPNPSTKTSAAAGSGFDRFVHLCLGQVEEGKTVLCLAFSQHYCILWLVDRIVIQKVSSSKMLLNDVIWTNLKSIWSVDNSESELVRGTVRYSDLGMNSSRPNRHRLHSPNPQCTHLPTS